MGLESVKNYYGKILKSSQDLKTSACCTAESMPLYLRETIKEISSEVLDKFYGCGSPIPNALNGLKVLDLGSGSGRDCFLMSKFVGENGHVTGIDMTKEQLDVAISNIEYHKNKFGYTKSNVEFKKGYIEDLRGAGIEENSMDLVTSNCVLNLSPDKERVFSEIFRALKPGGELYFSDVFASRRLPKHLREDEVMIGECLGGALYFEDFRRIMNRLGCFDFRIMNKSKIELFNEEIRQKSQMIDFYSITIRAFKLDLEDRCEDYGQMATYLGTIDEAPLAFKLDDHHLFETNKPHLVCGNTFDMLSKTRFKKHFKLVGDMSTHYGLFDCGDDFLRESEISASCC